MSTYSDWVIAEEDFFIVSTESDPTWGDITKTDLDRERLHNLARGPEPDSNDAEAALALLYILRSEYTAKGTDGSQRLEDADMRLVSRAFRRTAARCGVTVELPFQDHEGWYAEWQARDLIGSGSWALRRGYIGELFRPYESELELARDAAWDAALPVPAGDESPTWTNVDVALQHLRSRFRDATTAHDYSDVGNACVRVLEALSAVAYDHDKHGTDGVEPPLGESKNRLEAIVAQGLTGKSNAEVRGLTRKAIEAAHGVKHSPTPDALRAGIAADATILVTSMIQRIIEAGGYVPERNS